MSAPEIVEKQIKKGASSSNMMLKLIIGLLAQKLYGYCKQLKFRQKI